MEFKATLHVLLTGQQKQKDGEAEPATLKETNSSFYHPLSHPAHSGTSHKKDGCVQSRLPVPRLNLFAPRAIASRTLSSKLKMFPQNQAATQTTPGWM